MDLEEIRVCSDCESAIDVMSMGDESWDVCSGCRNVEGPTHYILLRDYEAR